MPSFLLHAICAVTRQKQLQTFGKVLEKRFEVKQTGQIGFGVDDEKELKVLNRTIRIEVLNGEMTLEADTKLVENALETMKLGTKGVDSPCVRRSEEQTQHRSRIPKLTSAVESTLHRNLVMKLAYVARDRVEITEAVKGLTTLERPAEWTYARTQKVGSIPGEEQEIRVDKCTQTSDATLQVQVDSDLLEGRARHIC